MKKEIVFLILISAVVISSCSTASFIKTSDSHHDKLDKTDIAKIEIYSLSDIGKSYSILGKIIASTDAGENSNIAIQLLKGQASIFGADAIVDLRLEFVQGYWSAGIKATGTAVKFENNVMTK